MEAARRLRAAGALPPRPPKAPAATLAEFAGETKRVTPMLRVPDVGSALTWYVSLGFTERGRHEEGGILYWAMLSFGNAELMLNRGSTDQDPAVALWFYVERVSDMYEVLKARQLHAAQSRDESAVEFVQHLSEPPYGGREFTIRDPNGFSLYFLGPA
jgi:uncharacterized glyoxalase superfamily protein PhnB